MLVHIYIKNNSFNFLGPVVFPQSPPDAPEESSGVVVGASGFGFVPPSQQSKK